MGVKGFGEKRRIKGGKIGIADISRVDFGEIEHIGQGQRFGINRCAAGDKELVGEGGPQAKGLGQAGGDSTAGSPKGLISRQNDGLATGERPADFGISFLNACSWHN